MSVPVETIIGEEEILSHSGFYWRENGDIKVLVCRPLEEAGFANGFSTRTGGVSPFPKADLNLAGFNEDTRENIRENRRRFLSVFGDGFEIAAVYQEHGNVVKHVADASDVTDSDDKADAMVSELAGVLLGIKTADCVPVLIGDPESRIFAAIHAGWRGTAARIIVNAVGEMEKLGASASRMIAAIGPAATVRNYEIGEDVVRKFEQNFEGADSYFVPTRPGHAFVDLHKANHDQLTGAGVPAERIFTAPFCTMERGDLFFSYRREKKLNGKTGRLLSVIGLAS